MHVANFFLKWFHVFHTSAVSVYGFHVFFSCVFYKCFIYLLCLLQLLPSECFKNRLWLHMGCMGEVAGGAGDVRGSAGPLLGR